MPVPPHSSIGSMSRRRTSQRSGQRPRTGGFGTLTCCLVLVLLALHIALPVHAQQGSDGDGGDDDGNAQDDDSNDLPPASTMTASPTATASSGTGTGTGTLATTSTAPPLPTYTDVVLDLAPTYQPNFFVHKPLPQPYAGSAAHSRSPDIYFRDCNYRLGSHSIVEGDLRINITSVYTQFDEDLGDTYIGPSRPLKGTLRVIALGEIAAQAHAADNLTNYLSAISIQSSFLTFPVFANLTYLCNQIFPTTADLLNPLINPASCAYGPGPVAIGAAIPIDSPYYLGAIQTQLRLSDPSKPARNIACISISSSPYRPHAWYWSFMFWLPLATAITYFVLAAAARLLTALAFLRARYANRAREGAGPNWVRDKLRPTLAAALSGEHLQLSAGLLRFASPGCWDVIYHLQFVGAIAMMGIHWPDWAYPFLKQAAWASLLGNVTVLNSQRTDAENATHIDVLRTYAALPVGDIGNQMINNASSPLFMNTIASQSAALARGTNRFLNLNDTAYGLPRYGYMLGLREDQLWPTAAVIWLYILAAVVGISAVLWLADWAHARWDAVRAARQAGDYDVSEGNGHAGGSGNRNTGAAVAGAPAAGRGMNTLRQSDSSAPILAPRSPGSTVASLNFGTRAPTPGGGGGGGAGLASASSSTAAPLGHASARLSPALGPVGSGATSTDGVAGPRRANSSSDALALNFGSSRYQEGAASKELQSERGAEDGTGSGGFVHSPGSTRWGPYRFLGGGGGGGATEKPRSNRSVVRATRGRGAPARLHLSALHGNVIRVIALFHFPLTILSIWGLQSHDGAHSPTQRALAAFFFVCVCVLVPLYALVRIVRASEEELYEDVPTFIQLGPLYNSYAPGAQRYIVALFVWTLVMGIVVGAAQSSGSAQALVLLILEVGLSVGSSLWLPWGEGANMGPVAFIGSVLRIITAVLLVLLSPLIGFGAQVAGWITYVILLIQALWFAGAFLIVLIKALELLVRVGFRVPYEEGPRTTYSGLTGAISQIRRRQDKILQLGSSSAPKGGGSRRPASRASTSGSVLNMTHSPGASVGGGGMGSNAGTMNKPIQLTHSRQVSYASYLDHPRMNQQAQHRLSQQASAMYGPYSGYFQADPHDEGGIMAAMPPSSPGLHGSSTAFGWGAAPAPVSTPGPGAGLGAVAGAGAGTVAAMHRQQGHQQQQQQMHGPASSPGAGPTNNAAGASPPVSGFVRLGGGRATDAQPWQSIPGTSVTARPISRANEGSSGAMSGGGGGGVAVSGTGPNLPAVSKPPPPAPSAATAAAVAAARRRPRPQSQTAVVGFNWAEAQAQQGQMGTLSPPTSPRTNEMMTLPDHRSSYNALAQTSAAAAAASGPQAGAGSGSNDGASAADGLGSGATSAAARKKAKRGTSGSGGGFWMRTKAKSGLGPKRRPLSGDADDGDDSFDEDEDEEDEEYEEEDHGTQPFGGRSSRTGASGGSTGASGGGTAGSSSGGVWSGLKSVVGGLRPAGRRSGVETAAHDKTNPTGFELDQEEPEGPAAPATTGFEVVRKPRRPAAVVSAQSAESSASAGGGGGSHAAAASVPPPSSQVAANTSAPAAPTSGPVNVSATNARDATAPASPMGDGSLPPQTDLGKLNAGLGLDFAAAGSLSTDAGTGGTKLPSPVVRALQSAAPLQAQVQLQSQGKEGEAATAAGGASDDTKPASDDPAFWRL